MLAAAGLVANPKIFEISLTSPVLCPMLLLSTQSAKEEEDRWKVSSGFCWTHRHPGLPAGADAPGKTWADSDTHRDLGRW
jgi:hypothetical protein